MHSVCNVLASEHTFTYVCGCALHSVHIRMCVRIHKRIHAYICAYVHTHMCTYTYIVLYSHSLPVTHSFALFRTLSHICYSFH